jgi:predicted PurR-regulated permease PerM
MALPDLPPPAHPLDYFRRRFTIVLAVVLLIAFFYMIADIVIGIVAGILLWVLTEGIFQWFLKKTNGRRGLSAGLSLVVSQLIFIIPIIVVAILMVADAATLADRAREWYEPYHQQVVAVLDKISHGRSIFLFGYELTMRDLAAKIGAATQEIGPALVSIVQKTIGGFARAAVLIGVAVYTLFFFYLDGAVFLEWLRRILPLSPRQSDRLITDFFETSKATLKTVGLIGMIQGVLGGVAFWICGIPAPFFWTVLMAIASVIPAVGSQIIIIPAGIMLILIGQLWWGIALILWGLVVIAHVDNVLRPYFVKRSIGLHQLLVFLGTIGGIATFGFFGVILGPVIAALLKAVLDIYSEDYGNKDSENVILP